MKRCTKCGIEKSVEDFHLDDDPHVVTRAALYLNGIK